MLRNVELASTDAMKSSTFEEKDTWVVHIWVCKFKFGHSCFQNLEVDFLSWSSLILSYGHSAPIWELTVWHFSGQALKQNEMRQSKELWEKDYVTERSWGYNTV